MVESSELAVDANNLIDNGNMVCKRSTVIQNNLKDMTVATVNITRISSQL